MTARSLQGFLHRGSPDLKERESNPAELARGTHTTPETGRCNRTIKASGLAAKRGFG